MHRSVIFWKLAHAFYLGCTSNSCFHRLFPMTMSGQMVQKCRGRLANLLWVLSWMRLLTATGLRVLSWKIGMCVKTHDFWRHFPYFAMGVDLNAKIDPKSCLLHQMPIIYNKLVWCLLFCILASAFLLESRFTHGSLLFCCFPCGFWFEKSAPKTCWGFD